jgi:hypothetical protein
MNELDDFIQIYKVINEFEDINWTDGRKLFVSQYQIREKVGNRSSLVRNTIVANQK